MPIPEAQLETWSHQGAGVGSKDTYATVKLALEGKDTEYAGKNYEVFLQGSYGNDTNVRTESDVDIVIQLKSIYYYDLSLLTPEEQNAFNQTLTGASDNFANFKEEVLKALRKRFGAAATPGSKAIRIAAENGRRNADVIVATHFRRYRRFNRIGDETYDQGICFFTDKNVRIANYPKLHSANCTNKHQDTHKWFKPAVRILKNMRQRLVDTKVITKEVAPSYFLEGLLYNVPVECFGRSYERTMLESLKWVLANDRTKFVCANQQYYLLGDHAVTWSAENCKTFLNHAAKLWDEWK